MSFVDRREDHIYTFLSKRGISPKRLVFIIGMLLIWAVFLTESERSNVLDAIVDAAFQFSLPPKIEFKFKSTFLNPYFVKLVFATIFSSVGVYALRLFLYQHLGMLQEKYDPEEIKRLVELIDEKTGIKEIIPCEGKSLPAIHQPYTKVIMKELRNSGSLKLLSIAGYENIGKGESNSLFYDFIKENHTIDLHVILLDPDGNETIDKRVSQLRKVYPSYTSSQLKNEIKSTADKIKRLKRARKSGKTELYYCKFHPIFRLIILDHCLFMNTYEESIHGHASPMYKIDKVKDPTSSNLSLYSSFDCLFENIRENSRKII